MLPHPLSFTFVLADAAVTAYDCVWGVVCASVYACAKVCVCEHVTVCVCVLLVKKDMRLAVAYMEGFVGNDVIYIRTQISHVGVIFQASNVR